MLFFLSLIWQREASDTGKVDCYFLQEALRIYLFSSSIH